MLRLIADDGSAARLPVAQQLPQCVDGGALVLDEHHRGRAARQRLQSERSGAGVEVQTMRPFDPALQPVKQGFAHTIGRRPYIEFGKMKSLAPPAPGDDAQLALLAPARLMRGGFRRRRAALDAHGRQAYRSLSRPVRDVRQCLAMPDPDEPQGFLARLKARLNRGGASMARDLRNLLRGRKIDAAVLEDLETRLLSADVGVEATGEILADMNRRVARHELDDVEALLDALRDRLTEILAPCEQPLRIEQTAKPFVVLIVGVNGSGKTTSIGKLARALRDQGLSVMLAAGDTFRAAAIEQLHIWAERTGALFSAQQSGADPGAVIFDALKSAQARGVDVLLADTAGRLHSQTHLMDELKKVKRVIARLLPEAPHEVLLVLDANQGQNALAQAQQFHAALGVTGLVLTKLDGTARGGIALAIARELEIPVKLIGVGETVEDLRPFDSEDFARALIAEG